MKVCAWVDPEGGGGGAQEARIPLENHKWIYVSLDSRGKSVRPRLAPILKKTSSMCHFIYLELVLL